MQRPWPCTPDSSRRRGRRRGSVTSPALAPFQHRQRLWFVETGPHEITRPREQPLQFAVMNCSSVRTGAASITLITPYSARRSHVSPRPSSARSAAFAEPSASLRMPSSSQSSLRSSARYTFGPMKVPKCCSTSTASLTSGSWARDSGASHAHSRWPSACTRSCSSASAGASARPKGRDVERARVVRHRGIRRRSPPRTPPPRRRASAAPAPGRWPRQCPARRPERRATFAVPRRTRGTATPASSARTSGRSSCRPR